MSTSAGADVPAIGLVSRLENSLRTLTRPLAMVGVLGMLLAAGATVVDVLLRWLANSGVVALNEITSMALPSRSQHAFLPDLPVVSISRSTCLNAGCADGSAPGSTPSAPLRCCSSSHFSRSRSSSMPTIWRAKAERRSFSAGGRRRSCTSSLRCWLSARWCRPWSHSTAIGRAIAFRDEETDRVSHRAMDRDGARRLVSRCLAVYGVVNFAGLSSWSSKNPGTTVVIAFALLWILMLLLMPLAAVTGIIGIVGCSLFIGAAPAMSAFATEATGLAHEQPARHPAPVSHDGQLCGGGRPCR